MRRSLAATAVVLVVLALAGSASAANRIYWGNNDINAPVSYYSLDGSGAGNILGPAATNPFGVGFDPATGKIYWASSGFSGTTNPNQIYVANIDGSGATVLPTGTATIDSPQGLVVDAAIGKVFWANNDANNISWANLNGSGGGDLSTAPITPDHPEGLTVYSGKVYWADYSSSQIEYANVDGGAGGVLNTGSVTPDGPEGVAIDGATGKIYWSNYHGSNAISYANLDGSGGGGNLPTGTATDVGPYGLALDPVAGKVYWTNSTGGALSYANLDGSGGADLSTGAATVDGPNMPALLEVPAGSGAPTISGGTTTGSTLACSQGSWGSDLVEALLYRAPQTFTYAWTLNGSPVAGATSSALVTASGGQYACRVTATNAAGSTTQASAAHTVVVKPPPKPTIKSKINATKHTAKFSFSATGATGFQCALIKPPKKHHKKPKAHFSSCRSPKAYKHLKAGKYSFEARGLDAGGSGPAATKKFTIF